MDRLPKLTWPSDHILRRINWGLLAVICMCCLYIVAMPFLPKAQFKIKRLISSPAVIKYERPETTTGIDRSFNHLIIPTISLDQPIHEGQDANTVNKGIWRRPKTSTPDKPSNTVLVGHRFTYAGASVLYLLDEVHKNDEIFVVWNQKIYAYSVHDIAVVTPDTLSVEDPSSSSLLTIYTCTPLWSTSHRLVVRATLEKVL